MKSDKQSSKHSKPNILEGFLYQCQFSIEGEDPHTALGYSRQLDNKVWVLADDLQQALDKIRAVYPTFNPVQCHQAGSWSTSGGMRERDRLII